MATPDDILEHMIQTCASAASVAAVNCIQHEKPLGYATLEDDKGAIFGIVVVCLSIEDTKAMQQFISSRGGNVALGRLN